jgi:uncharacterized membrane protein YdbT with pleckstrin-like domain
MNTISTLLDKNENILWDGRPVKSVFILSKFNPLLFFFGIFFSVIGAIIGATISISADKGIWGMFLVPHFWIGFAIWLGPLIYAILSYKNTHYSITNKRVFIQGGFFGQDTKIIDFDNIRSSELNIGVWDRLLKRGILISDGSMVQSSNTLRLSNSKISNITNFEEAFKKLKSVSFDVKTDIQYPNAKRSSNNPGYNTKLEK